MVDLLCIGFTRLYTTKNTYYTICGGMPAANHWSWLPEAVEAEGRYFPEFLLDFKLTGTLEGSDHVTISQQCPERWKMMKMEVLDFFSRYVLIKSEKSLFFTRHGGSKRLNETPRRWWRSNGFAIQHAQHDKSSGTLSLSDLYVIDCLFVSSFNFSGSMSLRIFTASPQPRMLRRRWCSFMLKKWSLNITASCILYFFF